jgi:hypothetical protein
MNLDIKGLLRLDGVGEKVGGFTRIETLHHVLGDLTAAKI